MLNQSTKPALAVPPEKKTPKPTHDPDLKPEVIVKEVCCCNMGAKTKASDASGTTGGPCMRKKSQVDSKSVAQTDISTPGKSNQKGEDRNVWKHILL